MKAVRFHEYGDVDVLRLEDVDVPEPGPGEVLVRVRACAVNHVDIDMRNGTSRLPITLPHTLGFEIAGEVAELGAGVSGVAVGDRVAPLYQIHCRECEWCARGEHMHCERIRMLGVQSPGGYAEYVAAPAWALIPLPDSLSLRAAARPSRRPSAPSGTPSSRVSRLDEGRVGTRQRGRQRGRHGRHPGREAARRHA